VAASDIVFTKLRGTTSPPPLPPAGLPAPCGPGSPYYRGFTITLRHATLGRNPVDEGSVHRRDFRLYNTQHSQQTHIHAFDGIRTAILGNERPQTHALDRAATGIDPR